MGTKKRKMEELLRESDTDQDYDHCVRCSKITKYKKSDNILFRSGYIEGAGQLCFECSHKRHPLMFDGFGTHL